MIEWSSTPSGPGPLTAYLRSPLGDADLLQFGEQLENVRGVDHIIIDANDATLDVLHLAILAHARTRLARDGVIIELRPALHDQAQRIWTYGLAAVLGPNAFTSQASSANASRRRP